MHIYEVYVLSRVLVSTNVLYNCAAMRNHFDVTCYLGDLEKTQIIKLGGALGLFYPNLKKMEGSLDDMVEAWLRKDDQVLSKSGHPTWKSLVRALELTGNAGIAENIRKDKL